MSPSTTELELWEVEKFGNYVSEHRVALLGNKCYPYSDNI